MPTERARTSSPASTHRFPRPLTKSAALLAFLFLVPACAGPGTDAEGKPVSLVDPQDGQLDLSEFMKTRTGFLPIPIIVTEPAVGYGGGLALMFLHDRPRTEEAKGPPSITVLGGAYTESDSWAGFLGHFGSWNEDRMRYTGILGKGVGRLEFFGVGDDNPGVPTDQGLDFELDGVFLRQQLLHRISDSSLLLGLRYEYASTETEFEADVPVLNQPDLDRRDGGLAAVAQYDTRDTIFTPSRGTNITLAGYHYDDWLGGESEFNRLELRAPFWVPLAEELVFGMNTNITLAGEETPFYALPYVTLRGVPALRYQGDSAASFEGELRWNFVPRWALVGFGGVGQAVADDEDFGGESYLVKAGGLGFRYFIAREFGLHVGLDVARGPEETVVYIQVGSAWH